MTSLILEEIGVGGRPEEVSASLKKEAAIFFDSIGHQRDPKKSVERTPSPPRRARLIERCMRRLIWWCLGCPIEGNA